MINFQVLVLSFLLTPCMADDYYSDKDYYEMAIQYEDNLEEATSISTPPPSANKSKSIPIKTLGQIYADLAHDLNCDSPWFWNAPRCVYIDVKSRHVVPRTKANARTSFIWIGGSLGLITLWGCALYLMWYWKTRNRRKLLALREQYRPGRITLPNGVVKEYQADWKEEKCYEEFVKACIIQEIALYV